MGNELGDSVAPELDGTTPPALAADGRTLTITFNEPMRTTFTPAPGAFTVKATPAGGNEETDLAEMATVAVDGSTVELVLAKPIAHNDTGVKVSYSKPTSGATLRDLVGNELASFLDKAVTNSSKIPRVSVSASHTDWTPSLAAVDFTFTRSNTDAGNDLTVDFEIVSDESYASLTGFRPSFDPFPVTIAAGQSSRKVSLVANYRGNVPGDLTIAVTGDDGHLPHPTGNSATVAVKVPASGRYATISHRDTSPTVTEGGSIDLVVDFVAHQGVARPKGRSPAQFLHLELWYGLHWYARSLRL